MCYRAVKNGVYDRDTFHKLQGEEGLKLRKGFRWLETYDLGYVKCGSCGSEDRLRYFIMDDVIFVLSVLMKESCRKRFQRSIKSVGRFHI